MTEKKRFTITQDFEENHKQIRDNGYILMGCFVEPQAEVIVDVLNQLNDENEQLKQQMQRLYNYFVDWFDDIMPSCNFSEMWDCVKEDEEWD